MNRRDLIIISLILLWGAFVYFFLPSMATTSLGLMVGFTCSMMVLIGFFILLIILSFVIKKFGEWGDKKLFKE